jgi:hypothetical protein
MPVPLTAPGVLVEFVAAPAPIDPAKVDVPAFITVCERGPLHAPTRIPSWPAFTAAFGGFAANGLGAYAVKAFFDNGGRACHVVRVAAPERATTLAGGGSQPADRRSSVVADTTGFVVGAAATIHQQGRPVTAYLVMSVDAGTSTVGWDRPLHPDFDLTGAVTLEIRTGAGTATAELGDAATTPVLRLRATGPGGWANHLSVEVTPGRRPGTRSRTDMPTLPGAMPVESVDGFAAGSLVDITQGTLGSRRVVTKVDASQRVLWWDVPLGPPLNLAAPLSVEADTFNLSIREQGTLREVHNDLTLVPGHPRFAETVLAGSALVRGEALPVPATHPAPAGWVLLTGGRDGTAALSLDDLLGDDLLGDSRGLAALTGVDEPAAIAIPDLVAEPGEGTVRLPEVPETDECWPCPAPPLPPDTLVAVVVEAPGQFSAEEIARAQQVLVEHCERRADRIALLDLPAGHGPLPTASIRDWRARFDSTYAALYVPWLLVVDPGPGRAAKPLRRVPPSGHVAGLIARTDNEANAWVAPANRVVRWAHAADIPISEEEHGILNELGVNVIRSRPGRGLRMMGARTVSGDRQWVFLNVRRLFMLLRRTLSVALQWTVFEPAGPALGRAVSAVVGGLLTDMWAEGAFAGDTPDESFFAFTDLSAANVGQFRLQIGIAPVIPAEFVIVHVERVEDRLELREQPERSA